ncbi:MAG: SDR family NAD(P)-dependent oxidoreductase, partial [Proteobacteria bacterium]|nr:SDR family NAD(P)-dependent oxidoreductase [Pseudomonadota bacterium]
MPIPHIKSALITGGAKRIGAAIAVDLATRGYDVGIHCHQSRRDADDLAARLAHTGQKIAVISADLSNANSIDPLFDQARAAIGPIGVLINNAALFERDDLNHIDPDMFHRHMQINCLAPMLLTHAMAAQNAPDTNVINIIDHSIFKNPVGYTSYTLSKSALWSATQMAAKYYYGRMRINAIAPGIILPAIDAPQSAHWRDGFTPSPLPHDENIDDIVHVVRYILDNPAIHGQLIPVDS